MYNQSLLSSSIPLLSFLSPSFSFLSFFSSLSLSLPLCLSLSYPLSLPSSSPLTVFPVINTQISQTMPDKDNNKIQYFILLILTDGIITDMKQTKNQIVEIANEFLPLSIVIVGIGNADFAAMDELDGDDVHLMSFSGQYSKRHFDGISLGNDSLHSHSY